MCSMPIMQKFFTQFFKFALIIGSLWYALKGLNPADLKNAFMQADWRIVAIGFFYEFCVFIPIALRIRTITGPALSFTKGYEAGILATGMNNILPAKLGEVTKMTLLSKCKECGTGRALTIVVWERFSDLNAMLTIGVIGMAFMSQETMLAPLIALAGAMWIALCFFSFRPKQVYGLVEKISHMPTRHFLTDFLQLIEKDISLSLFTKLAVVTFFVWGADFVLVALVLKGICNLPLGWEQVFTVFFFTLVGLAIPSTPGSAGVFEAAVIMGLGMVSIDKETALSAALILHMLVFVPPVIGAIFVLWRNDLKLKDLSMKKAEA